MIVSASQKSNLAAPFEVELICLERSGLAVEEFFLLLGREDWIHLFVAWFKHYESQKLLCMIHSKCPQLLSFIFGLFLILVRDGLLVRYTTSNYVSSWCVEVLQQFSFPCQRKHCCPFLQLYLLLRMLCQTELSSKDQMEIRLWVHNLNIYGLHLAKNLQHHGDLFLVFSSYLIIIPLPL